MVVVIMIWFSIVLGLMLFSLGVCSCVFLGWFVNNCWWWVFSCLGFGVLLCAYFGCGLLRLVVFRFVVCLFGCDVLFLAFVWSICFRIV